MTSEEKLLKYAESKANCNVSWKGNVQFFADCNGNISRFDTSICLAGHRFFIGNGEFSVSFSVIDLNFRGFCKKADAIKCSEEKNNVYRNISPLNAMLCDSVRVFEFNDGYICFIKTQKRDFEQILDVVSAKYRYSLSANAVKSDKNL